MHDQSLLDWLLHVHSYLSCAIAVQALLYCWMMSLVLFLHLYYGCAAVMRPAAYTHVYTQRQVHSWGC